MDKIAFLFPGQGAQYSGMGQDLFRYSNSARKAFQQIDQIIPNTSFLCFQGTEEELSLTQNTQPCVFAVNIAAASTLMDYGIQPDYLLGFSLGELSALTISKMLSVEDSALLVQKRAQWMHEASIDFPGSMAAVIGISSSKTQKLTQKFDQVWPVNFNFEKQTVVAGNPGQLQSFGEVVKQNRGNYVPLKVSGAFHTPYMENAKIKMENYLAKISIQSMKIPVISNKTALPYQGDYRPLISDQITHSVQFDKSINYLLQQNVQTFVEVGPGKTLSSLVKRIAPTAKILSVEDLQTLKQTLQALERSLAA